MSERTGSSGTFSSFKLLVFRYILAKYLFLILGPKEKLWSEIRWYRHHLRTCDLLQAGSSWRQKDDLLSGSRRPPALTSTCTSRWSPECSTDSLCFQNKGWKKTGAVCVHVQVHGAAPLSSSIRNGLPPTGDADTTWTDSRASACVCVCEQDQNRQCGGSAVPASRTGLQTCSFSTYSSPCSPVTSRVFRGKRCLFSKCLTGKKK